MMLLIIYFIWKAQLVKGEFLKEYWPISGELNEQDGPVGSQTLLLTYIIVGEISLYIISN